MSKQTLPIDSFLPEIVARMTEDQAVILMAEPGAGKTTRVPVAMAEAFGGQWVVLQPRRWAAKLTAGRIAEENGFKLGGEVGYQVRFERKSSAATRILLLTEGLFLRRIVDDPTLEGVQGVILDEFHERSLDVDLALALLKEIRGSLRPDLKLLVMSATLDPAPLERYLPGAGTLRIPGRTFPVRKAYSSESNLFRAFRSVDPGEGDTLVFLPGSREIERAVSEFDQALRDQRLRHFEVLPLYAALPEERQRTVFRPSDKRKVIFSTNIAETSITLPGVTLVIDSGLQKVMRMDPVLGMDRLETLRISRASAEQRAGRAGRVREGVCLRLWSEGEHTQFRHFETPEVQRVNLGRAILALSEFGVRDFAAFDWFEKPKSSMLEYAVRELESLGFLESGALTGAGREALRLPLEPRIAAIVIASRKFGVPEFGTRFAAWIENASRDEKIRDQDAFLKRLNRLSPVELRSARQIDSGQNLPELEPERFAEYAEVLVESGRSRIALRGRLVGRRSVRVRDGELPPAAILLSSMDQGDVVASSFVPLPMEALEKRASKKRRVFWDEEAGRVRASEGIFFEDLELGALREVPLLPGEAEGELVTVIRRDPVGLLSRNGRFKEWWERVAFYERHRTSTDLAPPFDWEEVLPLLCSGKSRLTEVLESDLPGLLEGALGRRFSEELERFAPQVIEVPTGGRIRIDYSQDPPRLSVRLQEVFGWLETPQLAKGRVPLLMELLSPGFKPIQLTRDLKSFWANAYFEVKKELKARYPKHAWPEDPLTAKPEAKGRRRL